MCQCAWVFFLLRARVHPSRQPRVTTGTQMHACRLSIVDAFCASIAFALDPQRFVMSYSHSPLGLFDYISQCLEPLNSEKRVPVPTPVAFFSIKREFFAQHEEPTPAPPRMSLPTVHLTNATPCYCNAHTHALVFMCAGFLAHDPHTHSLATTTATQFGSMIDAIASVRRFKNSFRALPFPSFAALRPDQASDTCGIRTHAGRPHRLSRPTP